MSSMDSLWNPSLRKTLSHPAAAHKVARGASQDGQSSSGTNDNAGASHFAPSKSVKHCSRSKLTALQPDHQPQPQADSGGASPPGRTPSKKGSLFEGFRNTLRPRGTANKGDPTSGGLCSSHSLDRSGENNSGGSSSSGTKGVIRRWSEITHTANSNPPSES